MEIFIVIVVVIWFFWNTEKTGMARERDQIKNINKQDFYNSRGIGFNVSYLLYLVGN